MNDKTEQHDYAIYGSLIRANRPLPILGDALAQTGGTPDVEVQILPLAALQARYSHVEWSQWLAPGRGACGALGMVPIARGDNGRSRQMDMGHGTALVYQSYTASQHLFLALVRDDGRTIDVGWQGSPNATPAELETAITVYWVPTLLGTALRLQDRWVLHGNAIVLDGRALVWCGTQGAGKSTLAAASVAAGYALWADDQVVLTTLTAAERNVPDGKAADAAFGVEMGVGRMRLWETSMAALAAFPGEQADMQLEYPLGVGIKGLLNGRAQGNPAHLVDRAMDVAEGGEAGNGGTGYTAPLPPAAVCLLGPRAPGATALQLTRLRAGDALGGLLEHCFGGRRLPLHPRTLRAEFEGLSQLVRTVPVYRLILPDRLDALPTVVATLARRFANPAYAVEDVSP
ncbi:MAG: hypothetical protein WDZ49_08755 [Litorilinea sp.]